MQLFLGNTCIDISKQKIKTNSPSEKRDHGDDRSYERPVDWTTRRESRQCTNMPLVPVNAASLVAAKTVTHGPVPIALSAGVHSIKSSVVTVASDVALSSADLALQDTGALSALSAAEYGRLAD